MRAEEVRLLRRHPRAFAVGDASVGRKRRILAAQGQLHGLFARHGPWMKQIQIDPARRWRRDIGLVRQPGHRILGREAGDIVGSLNGLFDRRSGKIRCARIATPLSDIHGHREPLVAVALDVLQFPLAHRDAQAERFRCFGRRIGSAQFAGMPERGIHEFFEKGAAVTEAAVCTGLVLFHLGVFMSEAMILACKHRAPAQTLGPILEMSRKPKKGYYVSGQFVAEGSALDLELKRELKGTDEPSRTERKRESSEVQKIGEELLTLRAELLQRLALPEKLGDALTEAKRISNFEGKRRQMQFIGKLMRQLDAADLDRVRTALAEQQRGSASETLALHQAEQWRDDLIANEGAFEKWVDAYRQTDGQQLRALIRQVRKDAVPGKPGEAPRHGKAYRELFLLVREQMTRIPDDEDAPHASHTTQF